MCLVIIRIHVFSVDNFPIFCKLQTYKVLVTSLNWIFLMYLQQVLLKR